MKKELGFIFIVFFSVFCVLAYSQSVPNPGHGADEIFVYINGKVLSLQSAIDLGEFSFNSYSGGGVANQIDFGHNDVYVDVDGVGKSLQSAINDNSLCLFEGGSGSYSGVKNIGHSADKILVNFNGEKNLQSAINQGLFSGKWDKVASDVCNGQSFTRSRCGISEAGTGTKTTGACCVASSWTPATDTVCSGQIFMQYSNCGTTISATGSKNCAPICTSHSSSSCSGGDVYWYNSCGVKQELKKDCTLPYSRGGCWYGYCVKKITRHYSSYFSDHMLSECAKVGVCESPTFANYGGAEMSFYLLNDDSYPSMRIALYRTAAQISSTNLDHMTSKYNNEGSPTYVTEGILGYTLVAPQSGTTLLIRKRLIGGNDHMDVMNANEGAPNYVFEDGMGYVITSGVQVA